MPDHHHSESHPVTVRINSPALQHLVATAATLGFSRHKTLQLCVNTGLAIVAARAGVPAPVTPPSQGE